MALPEETETNVSSPSWAADYRTKILLSLGYWGFLQNREKVYLPGVWVSQRKLNHGETPSRHECWLRKTSSPEFPAQICRELQWTPSPSSTTLCCFLNHWEGASLEGSRSFLRLRRHSPPCRVECFQLEDWLQESNTQLSHGKGATWQSQDLRSSLASHKRRRVQECTYNPRKGRRKKKTPSGLMFSQSSQISESQVQRQILSQETQSSSQPTAHGNGTTNFCSSSSYITQRKPQQLPTISPAGWLVLDSPSLILDWVTLAIKTNLTALLDSHILFKVNKQNLLMIAILKSLSVFQLNCLSQGLLQWDFWLLEEAYT